MTGYRRFSFIFKAPLLFIFFGCATVGALGNNPWDLCFNQDPQIKQIEYQDNILSDLGEFPPWEGHALNLLARAVNLFSKVFDGWPMDEAGNPAHSLSIDFETGDNLPHRLANLPLPWSLTLLEQTCQVWNGGTLQRADYREKWFESGINPDLGSKNTQESLC